MKFMIVQNCRYALNGITVVDFNKDQNLDGYDINLCNRLVDLGLAKRVDDEKSDSTLKNDEKKESKDVKQPKKTRLTSKKVSK
jgi:hypothetical protein